MESPVGLEAGRFSSGVEREDVHEGDVSRPSFLVAPHRRRTPLGPETGRTPKRVGKAVHVLTIARDLETESRDWADLAALVGRAQDGDREAFGELVEQFQPTVYAIALRRLANASDALELTQEVFLHVLRRIGQLREPERFAGWLRQVAVRMAINRATRRVSRRASRWASSRGPRSRPTSRSTS